MFEKLLSLFLHAKGGTMATVLVLGASGALVTATVDDGTATMTITQANASTAGSPATTPSESNTTTLTKKTTVDQAILALFTRTNAEDDPTAPATGKGCSDEAHETNALVRDVNDAYKTDHQALVALRKDASTGEDRDLVKEADKALKATRQAAVKLFHEAFDCDHEDTVDVEVDELDADSDEEDQSGSSSTDTTVVFSGDAKLVAELAISAMDKLVEDLKTALEDPEEPTVDANTTQTNGKADKDRHDNNGKGNGKGRN